MALLQRFVSERGRRLPDAGRRGIFFVKENYSGHNPIASLLPVYLDRPVAAKLPGEFKLTLTRGRVVAALDAICVRWKMRNKPAWKRWPKFSSAQSLARNQTRRQRAWRPCRMPAAKTYPALAVQRFRAWPLGGR